MPIILVVGLIAFIVLPNPILAWKELKGTREFLESESGYTVTINDPMSTEEIFVDSEAILRGEEADELIRQLKIVLKNIKYKETNTENIGIWKLKIVVNNANGEAKIYVDENTIFLANGNRLIEYSINENDKAIYDSFYDSVKKILSNEL